jgi:hypothetical protein
MNVAPVPRLTALAAIAFAALAAAPTPGETARAGGIPESAPPRSRKKLLAWLEGGSWRESYLAEPTIHDSSGPHGGNVRSWYSPVLVEDLREGRSRYRKGAAMVKELFGRSTTDVEGWSVMVKTKNARPRTPSAWVFYETFSRDGRGAFFGRGLPLCVNCHRDGPDFLQSPFRP